MSRQKRSVRAFTLIEVIVVFAIICVLISRLLPAVQNAREAARRIQCCNNLMQIGIAIQNYANAHGALPPGVVNETGPIQNTPKGYHFSWMTQLLAQLEQRSLATSINTTVGLYDPSNLGARRAVLRTLLCPSDTGPTVRPDGVAESNYAGCHHDREAPIAEDNNGVFFLNSRIRPDDVTDGCSYTIFVSEKMRDPLDLGWASGTRASLRNTGTTMGGSVATLPAAPGGVTELAPQELNPMYVGGFGSKHSGGANFGFGDGSVRFLKASINPMTFRHLGNRADGEMIDAQAY